MSIDKEKIEAEFIANCGLLQTQALKELVRVDFNYLEPEGPEMFHVHNMLTNYRMTVVGSNQLQVDIPPDWLEQRERCGWLRCVREVDRIPPHDPLNPDPTKKWVFLSSLDVSNTRLYGEPWMGGEVDAIYLVRTAFCNWQFSNGWPDPVNLNESVSFSHHIHYCVSRGGLWAYKSNLPAAVKLVQRKMRQALGIRTPNNE